MGVPATLLAGLGLTALALSIVLSGSPDNLARSNAVPVESRFAYTEGPATVCQGHESPPQDTSAVRISLEATVGPQLTVKVLAGTHLLTSGARGSGWTGSSVTVPVKPLAHAASNTTICFDADRSRLRVYILGQLTDQALAASTVGGRPLPGRINVEYLQDGRASWWSMVLSVARRMGLGRAIAGTWISLLALLIMLALTLIVCWRIVRDASARPWASTGQTEPSLRTVGILHRVPGAAWTCVLVACLNAVCWSIITPPFEVPDETSHFAYVQQLAENGRLPRTQLADRSPELQVALRDLYSGEVRRYPQNRSLATAAQQRKLEHDLATPLSRRGAGGAGTASTEPPLYYALELIPYALGSGGSILVRLELMRLLSALMAGITALFAYLFIREALPGSRWAWSVGGLAVALFPLLGFMSGGVNPDAMLFAVCTTLYYCLARAFRRGLTPRLAIITGALTATGFLTKLNFAGFAPGVILGLIFLSLRTARQSMPEARSAVYRLAAIALTVALGPVALYVLVNVVLGHPALGVASTVLNATGGPPLDEISYVWQFYLPRLPGMPKYFPGILTTRQLWFNGLVGYYGWADTLFPGWVYDIALFPAALIATLCVTESIHRHGALRRRIVELTVYGLTAIGIASLVGAQSYVSDIVDKMEPYWQSRYLLPMLALWGLVVALATRGAGRRWAPVAGTILIVLFLAHDIFSQLQVIARYYG
jgi:hypothetical protein